MVVPIPVRVLAAALTLSALTAACTSPGTTAGADGSTPAPTTSGPAGGSTTTTMTAPSTVDGPPFVLAPTSYAARGVFITPDPALTPGAADPRVTQDNLATTICRSGYTATVRPSTSVTTPIKKRAMASYGYASDDLASFELDHLVSLELGGAPSDPANLWPEPWSTRGRRHVAKELGAEGKDVIENRLHTLVCNRTVTLSDAQRRIATDWRRALDGLR
jgi:hypothetical protein